jgi:hypothetical protein
MYPVVSDAILLPIQFPDLSTLITDCHERTGDTVQIIRQELKSQRKHVNNLKKKSLWSKSLDDVSSSYANHAQDEVYRDGIFLIFCF